MHRIRHDRVRLSVSGRSSEISFWTRPSDGEPLPPVAFFHGAGGAKEDFADACFHRGFEGRTLLAWDAPGFGGSSFDGPSTDMDLLADFAAALLSELGLPSFHVVAHSMGSAVAQRVGRRMPGAIRSFTSIEGNLGEEDCFLSRLFTGDSTGTADFLASFAERIRDVPKSGFAAYAAALPARVTPELFAEAMRSLVAVSNGGALEDFLRSAYPRAYLYGEQSGPPSYLPVMGEAGIEIHCIPEAAHFPMYSNACGLWQRIAALLEDFETI